MSPENGGESRSTTAGLHPRMGRSRRRQRAARRSSLEINMAPMMDMTFMLMIFWLVTMSFERAEGILESSLPPVGDSAGVPLPMTPIVIRLTGDVADASGYALHVERFPDGPTRVEALTAFLGEVQLRPGFDAETPVVIVGGDEVLWDHVVGCWNAAVAAGCRRIAFAEPEANRGG